jgi:DNA repair exonuclease SbcCD ATPase subunit
MQDADESGHAADDPLDAAAARLTAAIAKVERRMADLAGRISMAEADARAARGSDEDRSRLADQLDAARAREAELSAAAEDAGEALDQAMAELREALAARGGEAG